MKTRQLDQLASFTSGGTPSRSDPENFKGEIPWITGADIGDRFRITPRSFITEGAVAKSAVNVVPPGTLLLVTRTSVGKVTIADRTLGFSQDITALRHDPTQVDGTYLALFLQSVAHQLSSAARGATIKGVQRRDVAEIVVPLPTLPEQRRIAAILDQADDLRTKRRRSLTLLDQLADSLFIDMFADELEKKTTLRSKLENVVRDGTSVTYGIVQAGPEIEGGIPYIRTGDLVGGQIREERLRHTSEEIARKFPRSRVSENEIVMSIRATVGTTALVQRSLEGANLTQGTARIAPGENIVPRFLLAYLRSEQAQRWIAAQVKGATFREITLTRLRELPICIPDLGRQNQFSDLVIQVEKMKVQTRVALSATDELFASLQHRAFAGEL
jgi:type I restriction enzyme S subunit